MATRLCAAELELLRLSALRERSAEVDAVPNIRAAPLSAFANGWTQLYGRP